MSEERIQQLETTVNEHSQSIRGINAALSEITETMKAFASGLIELRNSQQAGFEELRTSQQAGFEELRASQQAGFEELRASQQAVIETQRITLEAVDRLTNTVDNLAQTVYTLVTQEVPSLNAAVERLDRIVDYLIRRDSERNGN